MFFISIRLIISIRATIYPKKCIHVNYRSAEYHGQIMHLKAFVTAYLTYIYLQLLVNSYFLCSLPVFVDSICLPHATRTIYWNANMIRKKKVLFLNIILYIYIYIFCSDSHFAASFFCAPPFVLHSNQFDNSVVSVTYNIFASLLIIVCVTVLFLLVRYIRQCVGCGSIRLIVAVVCYFYDDTELNPPFK